jgi:hypothetical protein
VGFPLENVKEKGYFFDQGIDLNKERTNLVLPLSPRQITLIQQNSVMRNVATFPLLHLKEIKIMFGKRGRGEKYKCRRRLNMHDFLSSMDLHKVSLSKKKNPLVCVCSLSTFS